MFDAWRDLYAWSLKHVVRHRFITLLVAIGTLISTVYLSRIVSTGFVPNQDTGLVSGQTEFPQDVSYDAMVATQHDIADIVNKDPNVLFASSSVGGNAGRLNIALKPRKERALSADEVIAELRPKMASIPGGRVYLSNPPVLRVGGFGGRSAYVFTLLGQNLDELYRSSVIFEKRLHEIPGLADVSSDLQVSSPPGDARDRPRPRVGARCGRRCDRERALQLLRRASGIQHFHSEQ